MAIFNDRMKEKRLEKNISQREIADIIGTTKQVVQVWESSRMPQVDKAAQIAQILDVSLDYLTGLTNNPNQHKK